MLPAYFAGLSIGLSLIIAIGAQNAFILRQGLKGEHILVLCLICAVSDAALISLGVGGFGAAMAYLPWLEPLMLVGGTVFLALYGVRNLHAAWKTESSLAAADTPPLSLGKAVAICLAFTWLNPHVYLDTMVFIGAISTRFPGHEIAYGAGAVTGSFAFFFSLGYGARLLRPLLAKPGAWRVLDAGIGLLMCGLAVKLATSG